jgi:hypothetical protein
MIISCNIQMIASLALSMAIPFPNVPFVWRMPNAATLPEIKGGCGVG